MIWNKDTGVAGMLRKLPVNDTIKIPQSRMRYNVVCASVQQVRRNSNGKYLFGTHYNAEQGCTEVKRLR